MTIPDNEPPTVPDMSSSALWAVISAGQARTPSATDRESVYRTTGSRIAPPQVHAAEIRRAPGSVLRCGYRLVNLLSACKARAGVAADGSKSAADKEQEEDVEGAKRADINYAPAFKSPTMHWAIPSSTLNLRKGIVSAAMHRAGGGRRGDPRPRGLPGSGNVVLFGSGCASAAELSMRTTAAVSGDGYRLQINMGLPRAAPSE
jgi:hypothetical protein